MPTGSVATRLALLAGSAALVLTAGCAGMATTQPPPSSTSTTAPGGTQTLVVRGARSAPAKLHVGEHLLVVLASTYWQFHRPSGSGVLVAVGTPTVRARHSGCVAGAGCGTVAQLYVARAAGQAVIVASRTSCGEAMGCTGASGRYRLHVNVQ